MDGDLDLRKHVSCPVCGEGYPGDYPHGIGEGMTYWLELFAEKMGIKDDNKTREVIIELAAYAEKPDED